MRANREQNRARWCRIQQNGELTYDNLQRALNLSRDKRLRNKGRAVQLKREVGLARTRNKNKRHMLAVKNFRDLEGLAVRHIDI